MSTTQEAPSFAVPKALQPLVQDVYKNTDKAIRHFMHHNVELPLVQAAGPLWMGLSAALWEWEVFATNKRFVYALTHAHVDGRNDDGIKGHNQKRYYKTVGEIEERLNSSVSSGSEGYKNVIGTITSHNWVTTGNKHGLVGIETEIILPWENKRKARGVSKREVSNHIVILAPAELRQEILDIDEGKNGTDFDRMIEKVCDLHKKHPRKIVVTGVHVGSGEESSTVLDMMRVDAVAKKRFGVRFYNAMEVVSGRPQLNMIKKKRAEYVQEQAELQQQHDLTSLIPGFMRAILFNRKPVEISPETEKVSPRRKRGDHRRKIQDLAVAEARFYWHTLIAIVNGWAILGGADSHDTEAENVGRVATGVLCDVDAVRKIPGNEHLDDDSLLGLAMLLGITNGDTAPYTWVEETGDMIPLLPSLARSFALPWARLMRAA